MGYVEFLVLCVSIPHRQSGSCKCDCGNVVEVCFNSSQVVWKREIEILFFVDPGFNSSQVVWKPSLLWPTLTQSVDVSIPHRQSGSVQSVSVQMIQQLVSIPHRQSGSALNGKLNFLLTVFQFLIGSLEAVISSTLLRIQSSFNSSQVVWKLA